MNLFTKNGRPIAKNLEIFYELGRDSFSRLTQKHKKALVWFASMPFCAKEVNISIIDIIFTSIATVEISYNIGNLQKKEKCLFDKTTLEFYSLPIHIEDENRYEDFRSNSCSEFIARLEEYLQGFS